MASSSPSVIRDPTTAAQGLVLVAKCFQNDDSATLHQTLRALTAIISELTDANAPAAKELMQKAIPAVEQIANDGETDWAVEGFQIFQTCLDSPVSLLNPQLGFFRKLSPKKGTLKFQVVKFHLRISILSG